MVKISLIIVAFLENMDFIRTIFIKFVFSKKAAKIDEIFTVDLTLCSKCQIDGEDFVNFCGLLRKHELYVNLISTLFYFTNPNVINLNNSFQS